MAELPTSADIVVIGGGVMGTSTLYHLAAAGCTNVVLIERDTIASGSTSKAVGGIRAQFSDELNIRMALENLERFSRFEEQFGVDIDFRQWGYLFLLTAEHLPAFEETAALQRSLGVPTEILAPEAIAAMIPQLDPEGVVAGSFCSIDGHATPETVAQTYAATARDMGASVVQGCMVTGIDVLGGRVAAVTTTAGAVSTGTVVCTAGVWSVDVAAWVGIDLPVTPERRDVWLTAAADPLPHQLPLLIDVASGCWFQREGERILFGGRIQELDRLAPLAVQRLPVLDTLPVRPGWWGYYAMSPDHNAIVGAAADPQGFIYATGFSGHGFQQSPVVGEHVAQLALGQAPTFDLSPLGIERFESANLKPETTVI